MPKKPTPEELAEASKSLQQRIRRRALTVADAMGGIEVLNPSKDGVPNIEGLARLIRDGASLTLLGIAATMENDQDATRLIDAARRVRTK